MEALTPREVQIARMVAAGRSYKSIAAELGIAIPTVQVHVLNAAEKLGGSGSPKMRIVLFVVDLIRADSRTKEAS